MNGLKYKGILYFITVVILITLGIQVYWNYQNYQTGKQELINDVQVSLDNSVEMYYANLAKNESFEKWTQGLRFTSSTNADSIFTYDSLKVSSKIGVPFDRVSNGLLLKSENRSDSGSFQITIIDSIRSKNLRYRSKEMLDSIPTAIRNLSSKIIISFTEDTLSLSRMDSLINAELLRKNITIDYGLTAIGFHKDSTQLRPELIGEATLSTSATSPYSFHTNTVTIHFGNIVYAVMKKNLIGVFLSFVLVAGVVLCLMYLLKIIQKQKQLAEVKNDLINNITHEFKTPIATIGVAMEAIEDFNETDDRDKNLRYARISREQVDKLNNMVEKLLETATLDSEKLQLNLEPQNLPELLQRLISRVALGTAKQIAFTTSEETITKRVDVFHFENAINNVLDNAIKYGGDKIDVILEKGNQSISLKICDNGRSLNEKHKKLIFEKFYRVPKGNTHDVKGFGIGLYYTKKIVEKHQGTIDLHLNDTTIFEIRIPHD